MRAFAHFLPAFLLAFLVGVFFASADILPSFLTALLLLFVGGLFLVSLLVHSSRIIWVAVLLLGIASGIMRFGVWAGVPDDPLIQASVGGRVTLEGIVTDEPDIRETKTHLVVRLLTLRTGSTTEPVSGKLLIFVNRYPEYAYGDRLLISGKLETPKAFTGDDGRDFDYPSYLRAKGIRVIMSFAFVSRIGEGQGNPVVATLLHVKGRFHDALTRALPEPESSLLYGLLLGGKQSLGSEWLERFQVAGIVHIVVLSGYNMTIVAQWLVAAFGFLGFAGSLTMGATGILLFAIMTGGSATVVRAAILALFVLLARATGRTSEMGRGLLFAAAIMVCVDPGILLFDPSFQLSFLASLGLVYLTPVLEGWVSWWEKRRLLREVLLSTIATQIAVLPLLLFQTGLLSLISLPANLLVLPIIPLTMGAGFIAGVVALVLPSLALLAGIPAYVLLSYILFVAKHAAGIPFSSVSVTLSVPMMVALYVVLSICFFWRRSTTSHAFLVPRSKAPEAPRLGSGETGASDRTETPRPPQ